MRVTTGAAAPTLRAKARLSRWMPLVGWSLRAASMATVFVAVALVVAPLRAFGEEPSLQPVIPEGLCTVLADDSIPCFRQAVLNYQADLSDYRSKRQELDWRGALEALVDADLPVKSGGELAGEGYLGVGVAATLPIGQGALRVSMGPAFRLQADRASQFGPAGQLSIELPLNAGPDPRHEELALHLREAEAVYGRDLRAAAIEVIAAYLQVLLRRGQLETAETALELSEAAAQRAEERFAAGAISARELRDARRSLLQSRSALDGAHLDHHKACLDYTKLTGKEPPDADWRTVMTGVGERLQPLIEEPIDPSDPAGLIAIAEQHRSDLSVARGQVALAELQLAKQRRQAGLQFSLGGTVKLSVDQESPPLETGVGLTAHYPLFDKKPQEAVRQAEIALERSRLEVANLQREIESQVVAALDSLLMARQRVEEGKAALDEARQTLETIRQQYAAGMATDLDVGYALLAVEEAGVDLVSARMDFCLAVLRLWHAVGSDFTWQR